MRGNVKVYQKKIVDRRRKRFFFLSLWMLFLVGLIFCGLSYLSQLDSLTIGQVKVEGAVRLDPSIAIAIANDRMAGSYGYFFSKRNTFLYPRNAIQKEIAALPLVKEVSITGDGEHGLLVRIVERAEAVVWCKGDMGAQDTCFSVDENGFIFAPTTSADKITYRGAIEGGREIGSQVMPTEDFKNTQFFIHELATLGIQPTEVLMEDGGYMEISLAQGGKLIINTSDDLSAVLSNLSAVISDKATVPNLDAFLANLSYIRLDSGNKVFYKMKAATTSKK